MRLRAAYREINGFERSRMTLDTSRNPLFLADVTMPLKGLLLFGVGSERVTIECHDSDAASATAWIGAWLWWAAHAYGKMALIGCEPLRLPARSNREAPRRPRTKCSHVDHRL